MTGVVPIPTTRAGLAALGVGALVEIVLRLQAEVAELKRARPPGSGDAGSAAQLSPSRGGAVAAADAGSQAAGRKRAWVMESSDPEAENADPASAGPLSRSMSVIPANIAAVRQLRSELATAVAKHDESSLGTSFIVHSNFFLPDFSKMDPPLRDFLRSKFTSPTYRNDLEADGSLNWAVLRGVLGSAHSLEVLWTLADGNCLLHAVLLSMWGLHDRQTVGPKGLSSLRAALSDAFCCPVVEPALKSRWTRQLQLDSMPNTDFSSGDLIRQPSFRVELTAEQLNREWIEVREMASRQGAFLESIHVFTLAHVLRRPVIMLSSKNMKDPFGTYLAPINFHGLYLPLEQAPSECCRNPLVLCYQDSHFMPAVPTASDDTDPILVPLVNKLGEPLPLRYATDAEADEHWKTVHRYIDIEMVPLPPKLRGLSSLLAAFPSSFPAARLQRRSRHPLVKEMLQEFIAYGKAAFEEAKAAAARKPPPSPASNASPAPAALTAPLGASPRPVASPEAANTMDLDEEECSELEAKVQDTFNVTLPRSCRPGDQSFYQMPSGDKIPFKVPEGYYGGDMMALTITFFLTGALIKKFRDVTQCDRATAVRHLAKCHGNIDEALSAFFE